MKVLCRHGHYAFYPKNDREVFDFSQYFQRKMIFVDDYYTFEKIGLLAQYGIKNQNYGGSILSTTASGHAWEVFKENSLVYNLNTDIVVPIASITSLANIKRVYASYQVDNIFLQAGSIYNGKRVIDFFGEYEIKNQRLNLSGLYVE